MLRRAPPHGSAPARQQEETHGSARSCALLGAWQTGPGLRRHHEEATEAASHVGLRKEPKHSKHGIGTRKILQLVTTWVFRWGVTFSSGSGQAHGKRTRTRCVWRGVLGQAVRAARPKKLLLLFFPTRALAPSGAAQQNKMTKELREDLQPPRQAAPAAPGDPAGCPARRAASPLLRTHASASRSALRISRT